MTWILPPRVPRPRTGIKHGPSRTWPRHRRFVRSHRCCVPGCRKGPLEFAHVRSAANAGTSLKPFDWFGVSLCRDHHREQHAVGAATFMARHRIDAGVLAAELAARSPDVEMRAAMPEVRSIAPWRSVSGDMRGGVRVPTGR